MNIIEKLQKADWKDIAIRASKTFVEAFLSYVTIDGVFQITDLTAAKRFLLTTGISALAAGVSAVWNLAMELVSKKVAEELDELVEGSEDVENKPAEPDIEEIEEATAEMVG